MQLSSITGQQFVNSVCKMVPEGSHKGDIERLHVSSSHGQAVVHQQRRHPVENCHFIRHHGDEELRMIEFDVSH